MRLLLTADLHYNHPRSKPLAQELIDEMNAAGGDVLLLVGDTAVADGDCLEQCLTRFHFPGPKLFVAGNHELWTKTGNSFDLFTTELPGRVRQLGWQWLETDPFIAGDITIVGSVGWYDYTFAVDSLGIPRRFYQAKVSPGAALQLGGYDDLHPDAPDVPASAREIIARWNDGKFISLGRSDEDFLADRLQQLQSQLNTLRHTRQVIAAIHHVPFRQLLPPPQNAQWDFAKAFLGSERLGQLLLQYPNLSHAFCGHSHLPREAKIDHIQATNIGSGYRWKTYKTLDLQP